jgi:hypothetical protein
MTTTPPYDDTDFQPVFDIYAAHPMPEGNVLVLCPDRGVCIELERGALEGNHPVRRETAAILRESTQRVLVAVARHDQQLLPSDFQLWRDLHADLRGSDVELLPVRALPAA